MDEDAVRFAVGYASKQFVTDIDNGLAVLSGPYVLVVRGKLSSFGALHAVAHTIQQKRCALLVVADAVQGETLDVLVANKVRGIFQTAAIDCGSGPEGQAALDGLASATGACVVPNESALLSGQAIQLGSTRAATIGEDFTTVLPYDPGAGRP